MTTHEKTSACRHFRRQWQAIEGMGKQKRAAARELVSAPRVNRRMKPANG
jgi:hypothetical protein